MDLNTPNLEYNTSYVSYYYVTDKDLKRELDEFLQFQSFPQNRLTVMTVLWLDALFSLTVTILTPVSV